MIIALAAATACCPGRAEAATLTYRDCFELPGNAVAGLSGITREGDGDTYLAVMDNSDRVLRLSVALNADGTISAVKQMGELRLGQKRDLEGIAYDRRRERFFASDESPGIMEHRAGDGRMLRRIEVPGVFRRHTVRNQGFESLTLSPDGKSLWTANERALSVDGNLQARADPMTATTRVRLMRFAVTDDAVTAREQFEYMTSGVHDWGGQIGLCDLAALHDGRLLALERSAAMNFQRARSIRTRIFLVDVAEAVDVSGPAFEGGLVATPAGAGAKKLLLLDGFICGEQGANVEGLCLGPELGKNRQAVLGVVDSSDGGMGLSRSSVVSFVLDLQSAERTPPTSPTTGKSSRRSGATTQSR